MRRVEWAIAAALSGAMLAAPGLPAPGAIDPRLPALPPGRHVSLRMVAMDREVTVAPGVRMRAWTFNGTVPAPTWHVRVGDTVHVTFTNRGSMPHSIDFHAARTDWKTSFRTIPPGKSLSFTFRPQYAGAFLYHCGTPPVLLHIGSGMYGALIVDPIKPLPKARELVLVYSEFYLRKSPGVAQPDYAKMLAAQPDYAAFNGRAFQYQSAPIHVKRGERVRIYLVNAGPRRECAFHIIGQQFDTVYPAAPPEGALHGLQTYAVPPGGGAIFDLQADQAGTFPFVNHDVGHGDSGAIGLLDVRGAS